MRRGRNWHFRLWQKISWICKSADFTNDWWYIIHANCYLATPRQIQGNWRYVYVYIMLGIHLRVSRRSHYSVVIMSTMASQITSLLIVLLKHLFRRRSKKTSKLRVTGRCGQNSPVTGEFPTQSTSNAENVSIWWRHHDFEWRHLVITCDLIPLITRETWKKHIFLIGQYCACSRPLTFNCLVVCRHSDKTILALYSETTWAVGIAQLTHREVRGGGKNPETGGQGIFALTADRVVS